MKHFYHSENHKYVLLGWMVIAFTACTSRPGTLFVNYEFGDCLHPYPVFFSVEAENVTKNTEYFWSFGDGTTSNLQFPTHTYSKPGVYNVSVQVNNRRRESVQTFTINIPEKLPLNAGFTYEFRNGNRRSPVVIDTYNFTRNANSFTWLVDGEPVSVGRDASIYIVGEGSHELKLVARCTGDTSAAIAQVNVLPMPKVLEVSAIRFHPPNNQLPPDITIPLPMYVEFEANGNIIGFSDIHIGRFVKWSFPADIFSGVFRLVNINFLDNNQLRFRFYEERPGNDRLLFTYFVTTRYLAENQYPYPLEWEQNTGELITIFFEYKD